MQKDDRLERLQKVFDSLNKDLGPVVRRTFYKELTEIQHLLHQKKLYVDDVHRLFLPDVMQQIEKQIKKITQRIKLVEAQQVRSVELEAGGLKNFSQDIVNEIDEIKPKLELEKVFEKKLTEMLNIIKDQKFPFTRPTPFFKNRPK